MVDSTNSALTISIVGQKNLPLHFLELFSVFKAQSDWVGATSQVGLGAVAFVNVTVNKVYSNQKFNFILFSNQQMFCIL